MTLVIFDATTLLLRFFDILALIFNDIPVILIFAETLVL